MPSLLAEISTHIRERNPNELGRDFASLRRLVDRSMIHTEPRGTNDAEDIKLARFLVWSFFTYNTNSQVKLIEEANTRLTVWGSPLPRPSKDGIVAFNIDARRGITPTSQRNLESRLHSEEILNNSWVVIQPTDKKMLRRYNWFRFGQSIIPSTMFYNQPNRGERVHKNNLSELYYLPSHRISYRMIIDHTPGMLWDGEWSYNVRRAKEAPRGATQVSLRELQERSEELGLSHVTIPDRIFWFLDGLKRDPGHKLPTPYGYRGLFAYPPQRKAR